LSSATRFEPGAVVTAGRVDQGRILVAEQAVARRYASDH
jgi:hypothetical protein